MKELSNICSVCPRNCQIDRTSYRGFCNENEKIRIAKIIKNFQWEEPCLIGDKGTLAIFFSGCNLRCDYCQNYQISRGGVGEEFSIEQFVKLIEENQNGHSSIDLITPTHFSKQLSIAFEKIEKRVPVIWNTNSYETVENIRFVSKFVDVFLADLKYSNDDLGQKFSACKDYFSKAFPAIKEMHAQKSDLFDGELMRQGMVVRHLVLPGEIENSLKVLEIIKQNFTNRKISLMSQFTPNGKSKLNRKLKPIEYKVVVAHMQNLGLLNGYIQEFESASEVFVPDFL